MEDQFVGDLQKQLKKTTSEATETSPWGEVNPLVIIGLTEAILDLGLTEEQMYAVIRSYGRQLVGQVHPDRNPANFSADRQRQIIEAFVFLDDPGKFSLALADFKNIRAEERRESKILRGTVSALRRQISSFELQARTFLERRQRLEEDRAEYERLVREEPLVVPKLEEQIEKLKEKFDSKETNYVKRIRKLVAERDDLAQKVRNIKDILKARYKDQIGRMRLEIKQLKERNFSLLKDSLFLGKIQRLCLSRRRVEPKPKTLPDPVP